MLSFNLNIRSPRKRDSRGWGGAGESVSRYQLAPQAGAHFVGGRVFLHPDTSSPRKRGLTLLGCAGFGFQIPARPASGTHLTRSPRKRDSLDPAIVFVRPACGAERHILKTEARPSLPPPPLPLLRRASAAEKIVIFRLRLKSQLLLYTYVLFGKTLLWLERLFF